MIKPRGVACVMVLDVLVLWIIKTAMGWWFRRKQRPKEYPEPTLITKKRRDRMIRNSFPW